mgnify:CR=1 FL=1
MRVLLVYNDGLVDSFDTTYDPSQEYTHSQLVTFVEEDPDEEGLFEVGIDLMPMIHTGSKELPTTRRLCKASFSSNYPHGSRPSIATVCSMVDGLQRLIVDGAIIWEGDPAPYLPDDTYADEVPETNFE